MPRVTGGVLRGRRLGVPRGDAARPTTDRVREALFSALGSVEGARVLDLYAGSGALGIEALSRGAQSALFVERASRHAAVIRANLAQLDLREQGQVLSMPVERALRLLAERGPFDLLFADPPYAISAKLTKLLERLGEAELSPQARLVIEHAAADEAPQLSQLSWLRTRRYGGSALSFYERSAAELP